MSAEQQPEQKAQLQLSRKMIMVSFDRGSKIIQSNHTSTGYPFNRKKQYCSEDRLEHQRSTQEKSTLLNNCRTESMNKLDYENELPKRQQTVRSSETPFGKLNKEGKLEVALSHFTQNVP